MPLRKGAKVSRASGEIEERYIIKFLWREGPASMKFNSD
jgi:hypothetical protein